MHWLYLDRLSWPSVASKVRNTLSASDFGGLAGRLGTYLEISRQIRQLRWLLI